MDFSERQDGGILNLADDLKKLLWIGRFAIAVFAIHCVLSLGFHAYDRIDWLDIVMHTLGGLAIASFFDELIKLTNSTGLTHANDAITRFVVVVGLVALVAVFWEFAEYSADTLFNLGAQRSVANTMKDQFFGLAGGAIYASIVVSRAFRPKH